MAGEEGFVLLLSFTLCIAFLFLREPSRALPLPPGPTPWPVIGNALQISLDYQHKTFCDWQKQYGNMIYFSVLGKPAVVLNSLHIVQDLLEKRSAKYADRPHSVLIDDIIQFSPLLPLIPYGDEWRRHRRWIQSAIVDKSQLDSYRPLLQKEAIKLLSEIVKSPEAFAETLKHYVGAIMIQVSYGRTSDTSDDAFIELADRAVTAVTEAGSVSASLVDFFPFLRYVPAWFPGFGWKRTAVIVKHMIRDVLDIPFDKTRETMANGTAGTSFLTKLLEETLDSDGVLSKEDERALKGVSSVLYAAGTDTSSTTLVTFVLAMVLNPDIFRKAQAEVDAVVGRSRLPGFHDRESLPYVECLIRELYRWNPPLPLGVPYQVMGEDEYQGFHIPDRSIVMANIWQINRDPSVYPDSESFRPERYLEMDPTTKEVHDPLRLAFGFGRRACPGRQLGDAVVWLAITSMLATLDLSKASDQYGNEITPAAEFMPGVVRKSPHTAPVPYDWLIAVT